MFCANAQKQTIFFHLDKMTIKKNIVKDSTDFKRYENAALQQFKLQGYTGIELKDTIRKRSGLHYMYVASNQFKRVVLQQYRPEKDKWIRHENKGFKASVKSIDEELKFLENHGFPFAQIRITNQKEKKNKLILEYEIDTGEYYEISEIHLKSQDKFHDKTVLKLIDLNVDEPYNESKISSISSLLKASGMYKLLRPVEVLFRKDKAEIFIYFEKQKSSTADGYIGFQQDQITEKLVLNGYINLALNNALNRAEVIDMHWKSNPDQTQNLKAHLAYPFLFSTPVGLGARLDLRKQDSTFLRTDITLNASYYHPYMRFTLFNQIEGSSTLRATAPAEYRNYRKNTVGATAHFILPELPRFSFYHPEIYMLGGFYNYRDDTLDDNTQKLANSKYELTYRHKIDFLRYFHLNNTVSFQGLTSSIELSRNELIYFGGLQTVRGFYELELSGNDIWMFQNELEFRPIDLMAIFLLYDYSTFKRNGQNYTNSYGFGFSLNGDVSSLRIIVANGVLNDNPFQISNTKIHIGFKSTF